MVNFKHFPEPSACVTIPNCLSFYLLLGIASQVSDVVQKPLVDIMHNIKTKTWYAMLLAFLAQFGFKSLKFVTLFKTDIFL